MGTCLASCLGTQTKDKINVEKVNNKKVNETKNADESDSKQEIINFKFAVIADQDKASKQDDNSFVSYLLFGEISLNLSAPDNKLININIDKETHVLELKTDVNDSNNRGGELSVLNKHILAHKSETHLITGCDKTGILYEIENNTFKLSAIGKLIKTKTELIFINADDFETDNPDGNRLKIEWMTRKNDCLIIGSNVVEKRDWNNNGQICEEGRSWIAEYKSNGTIQTFNWIEKYNKLRYAVGAIFPGWIHIEACIWSEIHKKWFIAPRYLCINAPFDALFGNYGCNLLLIADEDFNDIKYVEIKLSKPADNNIEYVNSLYTDYNLLEMEERNKMYNGCDWDGAKKIGLLTIKECDKTKIKTIQNDVCSGLYYSCGGAKGFSCAQFVVGTNDNIIIAVRTLEKADGGYASYLCIFDINGNVFVEDYPFKGNIKYEGLTLL